MYINFVQLLFLAKLGNPGNLLYKNRQEFFDKQYALILLAPVSRMILFVTAFIVLQLLAAIDGYGSHGGGGGGGGGQGNDQGTYIRNSCEE